jgi:cytochrome c oxidase subunit 3
MATLSHSITVEEEARIGGGGTTLPPDRGRGGDRDRGGDSDSYWAFQNRLRRARLGMYIAMASIVMLFAGFGSAFIVRQGIGFFDDATRTTLHDWRTLSLPIIVWLNTMLLAASSFTLEHARRKVRVAFAAAGWDGSDTRQETPWLNMTLVLGVGFLLGQVLAWRQLAEQGIYLATNPSSSFFYVFTATHGLHLLGGVAALAYAAMAVRLGRGIETRRMVLEVTALYWHFMGVLWIYILGLLYLGQ